MKSLLRSLLVASFLFVSCAASAPQVSPVQPLRVNGDTFCTAFSINQQDGYWATAGHCAVAMRDFKVMGAAFGVPMDVSLGAGYVEVAYIDSYADIAVLKSSLHVKPFKLASDRLAQNDPVEVWGFPYGLERLIVTRGHVAGLDVPLGQFGVSTLLDVTVAGGNSGSPVLRDGQIAGVVSARFNDSMLSIAVAQAETKRVLKPYTE